MSLRYLTDDEGFGWAHREKAVQVTPWPNAPPLDSFECAIRAMAPTCVHCGCRVIGHGHRERGRNVLLRHLRTRRPAIPELS